MSRTWLAGVVGVAALLLVLHPQSVGGAGAMVSEKSYAFAQCKVTLSAPVEVGRARGHFWFASLHAFNPREVLCEVVLADDKAQGEWPARLMLTRDGGATWKPVADIASYGPASVKLGPRKMMLLPYELWPAAKGDKRNGVAKGTVVTLDDAGRAKTERAEVKYLGFPRDVAPYNGDELTILTNGNVVPLKDGRLMSTVYGTYAGDKLYDNWAMASDDGGFTWRYLSAVATPEDLAATPEGPCESNTARLGDGRLMCVYRVGSGRGWNYRRSFSADEGATWGKPEEMKGVFSVEPQVVRLRNGVTLLSGGREGVFLWASADDGTTWERVNLGEHHNAMVADEKMKYPDEFVAGTGSGELSTSYTGMIAVGDDEALVCYDRLANSWHGAPGAWGEEDAVWCVRVKVARAQG